MNIQPPSDDPATPQAPGYAPGSGFSLGFVDATMVGDAAEAAASAPMAVGDAAYVLTELIGMGGQGEVWEAWQPSLRRTIAVKIHHAGSVERFAREALLTGGLEHPSIVPVLDFGALVRRDAHAPPATAMAMKRLRGRQWDSLIAEDWAAGRLPAVPQALARHFQVLEAVCRALSYAHSRGVLHLDLKPSQVIVGEFGETYLCDWGMAARVVESPRRLEFVCPPSGPFGTPPFMAPEQSIGDVEAVGVATDVYLASALAYFVLAGRPPHSGESVEEVLGRARRNQIPPLDPSMPPGVCSVVMRGLSTLPGDRHPSVEDFRAALAEALRVAERELEAGLIRREVQTSLLGDTTDPVGYPELMALEQRLERALALAPGETSTADLRDRVLDRHASLAIERGDLALADVLTARIGAASSRERLIGRVAAERSTLARRDRQRVFARRAAALALLALVGVLLASSGALYSAFERVAGEKERAEAALGVSRRELARASLQAAMGHLDKQRPADARAALAGVPIEWRHWEWGLLASSAVPESRLLRPRGERFRAVALSLDGTRAAALREDGHLVLERDDVTEVLAPPAGTSWTAVGGGPAGSILAGRSNGTVTAFGGGGLQRVVACGGSPIRRLGSAPGVPSYAVDESGSLWRFGGDAMTAEHVGSIGGEATLLSVAPQGIAVGKRDGTVWHAEHGAAPTESRHRHTAPVIGLRWRPGAPMLISWAGSGTDSGVGGDPRGAVHRVGESSPVFVTADTETSLTAAEWTPSGDGLALAFANLWLHELVADTWQLRRSTQYGVGTASSARFLDGGRSILFLSRSMIQTREMEWMGGTLAFRGDSRRLVDWAFEGGRLLTVGEDGGLAEWRLDRPADVQTIAIPPDRISSLDVAQVGERFVTAQRWGWSKSWSLGGSVSPEGPGVWADADPYQIRVSSDGARAAVIASSGRADLIALAESSVLRTERFAGPLSAVAMHPSGSLAAIASMGRVVFMASEPSTPLREVAVDGNPTALHFVSSGERLLAADERAIRILDGSGAEQARLTGHSSTVRRLATDRAEEWLVAACVDERAHLWNLRTATHVRALTGSHSGPVVAAVLTPDGRRVLTACADSLVRVFDRATGIELTALQGHRFAIQDMVLAPDGRRLVTAGYDSTLRVWEPLPWDLGDAVLEGDPSAWRRRSVVPAGAVTPPASAP